MTSPRVSPAPSTRSLARRPFLPRRSLVSMSTTLATNALVEGQGGRVALVMIGFAEADLERDRLKAALGHDPVLFLPGGHDVHGNAATLDLSALEAALPKL